MTKRELEQVYYLSKEVDMWQKELERIQFRSVVRPPALTGLPGGTMTSDNVGETASEIADIKAIIRGRILEIEIQRKNIMEYILTLEDSFMRQILFKRHVSLMGWVKIAGEVGGGNTADSVRMAHDRFLRKK